MLKKTILITFIAGLFFFYFSSSASNVLAYPVCGFDEKDSCDLPIVSDSYCAGIPNPGTCAKSVSCPACETSSGDCCPNVPSWTKWNARCVQIRTGLYSWAWVYDVFVCSTGDKCVPGETGLRPGYCDCSYGTSIYKYCCDANGNPEGCVNYYLQDGIYPPEGECPGGYLIDGVRVRSTPCTGLPAATSTPVPGGQSTPVPTTPLSPNPYCSLGSIESCDSWIEVDVPSTAVVGDVVPIRAFEHTGWGAEAGNVCLYGTISYNVQGAKNFGFNASNFNLTHYLSSITTSYPVGHTWYNNRVVEGSYLWNTAGFPEGTYTITSGWYGGHGDNCHPSEGWSAPCCDEIRSYLGGAYTSQGYMKQILGRSPQHTITLCTPKPPDSFNCFDSPSIINSPPFPAKWSFYGSWNDCGVNSGDKFTIYTDNGTGGEINTLTNCQNLPAGTRSCNITSLSYGKTYRWQVEAVNTQGLKTRSSVCAFTVKEPDPWWQTTDGDVHAQGTITSLIPSCSTTTKYLANAGDGGSPGVVSWGGGFPPILEQGAISVSEWQANTLSRRPPAGFDYFVNRLKLDKSHVFNGDLTTASDGLYYVNAANLPYTLQGAAIGTKKIVLFVEGDVNVASSITVSSGGFFALISKGKIVFNGTISRTEGFYFTDDVIDTGFSKSPFAGYGSFIALGGFNFQRDLSNGTTGGCTPAETFFARPDLYLNAPQEFLISPSVFQEVAP